MNLEQRQAKALSILEKMQREQPASNDWVWGLVAAGLAGVVVWMCRFW